MTIPLKSKAITPHDNYSTVHVRSNHIKSLVIIISKKYNFISVICVLYVLPKLQIWMESQLVGWRSKIQKPDPENSQLGFFTKLSNRRITKNFSQNLVSSLGVCVRACEYVCESGQLVHFDLNAV